MVTLFSHKSVYFLMILSYLQVCVFCLYVYYLYISIIEKGSLSVLVICTVIYTWINCAYFCLAFGMDAKRKCSVTNAFYMFAVNAFVLSDHSWQWSLIYCDILYNVLLDAGTEYTMAQFAEYMNLNLIVLSDALLSCYSPHQYTMLYQPSFVLYYTQNKLQFKYEQEGKVKDRMRKYFPSCINLRSYDLTRTSTNQITKVCCA